MLGVEMKIRLKWIVSVALVLIVSVTTYLFRALRSDPPSAPCLSHKNPEVVSIADPQDEVTVNDWRLIGPFQYATPSTSNTENTATGLGRDFLGELGHPEGLLTESGINSFCASAKNVCGTYTAHSAVIPLGPLFPNTSDSILYAVASIRSSHEKDLVLDVAGNQGIIVWVNGQIILSAPQRDKGGIAVKYRNMPALHLHSGNNLLIIKSDSGSQSDLIGGRMWALITSLMPLNSARNEYIEALDGYFIYHRFLKTGEQLKIWNPRLCQDLPMRITITDGLGDIVFSKDYDRGLTRLVDTKGMREGYYAVALQIGQHTAHDEFYLGNPDHAYQTMIQHQQKTNPLEQNYIQRDPMVQRYRILTSQQYSHPDDTDWQRKLLLVLKDYAEEEHIAKDAEWTALPGMHFREYISKIDGAPQNYLLYVPHGVRGPMPLVIEMPYALLPDRPFLESGLPIAWPRALDDLESAAEQSQVSVAVIYGRGTVGDAPIGEADTFEALNDITSHYPIDLRRMYLFGICEGGRRALMLGEHFPGVFAAVGAYGPMLKLNQTPPPHWWSVKEGAIVQVDRLANTPVKIVQGEFDELSQRPELLQFFRRLKAVSPKSDMNMFPEGLHGTHGSELRLFPWLLQQTNALPAPPIAERTNEAMVKLR
ncbi:MAG: dienelactone hydrolase family protein [Terracidiphilus sp.]|jgi:hypothetical protein